MTTETTQQDPKSMLRGLYKAYLKQEPAADLTGTQLRTALRDTKEYKDAFSKVKDEGAALDEMMVRITPNQEVPAWLINPDHVNEFQGKKKGHGALFRLPSGKNRFVDYGGKMPNAPNVLAEFVFPGVTVIQNVGDGTEEYDFRGSKPIAKKHGQTPPASDLTQELARCWKYNAKKGVVIGESYDHVFSILRVTEDDDKIRFYPPGDFSDKPKLSYYASDSVGNVVIVEADVEDSARQLGIEVESPSLIWKQRLRGMPIAGSGSLSVFLVKTDRFFGGDGRLATAAAEQGGRFAPRKDDANKGVLNLSDLYNAESSPQPAIRIGDTWVYRLESRTDGEKTYWNAYVRADQQTDKVGQPLPPTLNCAVKTGVSKAGKPYAINEGAFVTYLGAVDGVRKATEGAKQMLLVE